MNKLFTLLIFASFFLSLDSNAQTRYLDEVFDDVDVQMNVIYGANTTVLPVLLGATPALRPLNMNVLTPAGDTETNRPMVIMLHTGNFLPQYLNGAINGTENDAYVVSIATRLAKMGYVVGLADYRKGWNPTGDQEARVNTLINAAYRGVQDANTCARYLRKTVDIGGNPFGIDPEKIVLWGVGTGAYVSYGAGTIDQYLDVVLDKFIGSDIDGDGNPDPMVIPVIHGDPFATTLGVNPFTQDTLCFPNHAETDMDGNLLYSSDFQLVVAMGGAIGDTSWIDANDPPMISYHVPTDPFAPYDQGILTVPTTGDLIVEVQGAFAVQNKLAELGNNDVFNSGIYNDSYTDAAQSRNNGSSGLFPMPRPSWDLTDNGMDDPEPVEASPWEFWDPVAYATAPLGQVTLDGAGGPCEGIPIEFCNWDIISRGSNPDMTMDKAIAYQDTIVQYFAPRACLALNLPDCVSLFSDTEDVIKDQNLVKISPNPVSNRLQINSASDKIQKVDILDISGRLIMQKRDVNDTSLTIEGLDNLTGIHFIKTYFENGVLTKKIIFQ